MSTVNKRTAEWTVLLECASPEFQPQRLAQLLDGGLDWNVLVPLAEEQGIIGLLAERVLRCDEASVPGEVVSKLRRKRRALSLFTLGLTAELFRLLENFKSAALETLVVKGPALSARAYGDPGIRQYEDVDLLVRQRDAGRAAELMAGCEYESKVPPSAIKAGKIPGEYVFRRAGNSRRIELHTEQTLRYFPRPLPVEEFFKRKALVQFDAHAAPALCAEDELLLDCIHGAKHFWERLMRIADVAGLVAREKDLDWQLAFSTARSTGSERMLCLGLLLAAITFGTKLPKEVERACSSDPGAARLADEILQRLSQTEHSERTLPQRAVFRMRMRRDFWRGMVYLLRLTLSPTEEDWMRNNGEERAELLTSLLRPMRLARKHWRGRVE